MGFVLPVLEYFSAMWRSAVDAHLKLLDRVVSGAHFLTGGVFVYYIAHHQSVAVLSMLYKIRYSQMHHFYGAVRGPYVPMQVTRDARSHIGMLILYSSLQNLAVPLDFYSILSVSVERSC